MRTKEQTRRDIDELITKQEMRYQELFFRYYQLTNVHLKSIKYLHSTETGHKIYVDLGGCMKYETIVPTSMIEHMEETIERSLCGQL